MTSWVIVVENLKDFPNADTPHKVITAQDYVARPQLFGGDRAKIINLARSYAYQSEGYYCSLLAEARGHRVLPTVESMLDLGGRGLYHHALPELEDSLNQCARKAKHAPEASFRLLVCFGLVEDKRYERFASLLFDWFRCPALEVEVEPGPWLSINRMRLRPVAKLDGEASRFFREALHTHTRRDWRSPKARPVARYDIAVLHDPNDELPPSSLKTLKHFSRIAEKMSVDVEFITRRQLAELAEFDALFIRETTSIDNHTYRFARRAMQEGMPVIDDPRSMIRCTNKVYLHELMAANGVPVPPTVLITGPTDLAKAEARLGYPMVLKIPDGSFSRGVSKVDDREALEALAREWFEETDLLLAQQFMPTEFDWRVGVLGGEPLFVCQYLMAKKHWQIIKHSPGGKFDEGGFKTVPLAAAPPAVIEVGVKAARLIGDGLYGVDLKETSEGVVVIEVNDNPNLEHGVEDAAEKDEVWVKLLKWFIERIG